MWQYLAWALAFSVGINVLMFVIAFRLQTDKLTDASYAVTFIGLAIFGLVQTQATSFRILLFSMIVLWAIRLGGFLLFRVWKTGKDSRFDAMRGNFWKFGKFWLSQGLSVWIILLPTLLALRHPSTPLTDLCYTSMLIWLVGVAIETFADLQKYRFSSNPGNKGKWIDEGLWHYSRHPNYCGEITVWVGVYLYACTALTGIETLVGLASPVFIAVLLLFVSGIPILEKGADARWGKDKAYQAYKRRTSLLLPWPPHPEK